MYPGTVYSGPGALSGWLRRVGATLLDGLIVGVPLSIIFAIIGLGSAGREVIDALVFIAYAVLLIGGRGQTVGDMVVTSQIVDATTGAKPTYGKVAIRVLVSYGLGITVIGGILDILWPLWDDRNQTIHDKAAGTLMIRTT